MSDIQNVYVTVDLDSGMGYVYFSQKPIVKTEYELGHNERLLYVDYAEDGSVVGYEFELKPTTLVERLTHPQPLRED